MLKDRLLDARLMRGYTQDELGEMIGYPKLQVSRWENGRNIPNSEALAGFPVGIFFMFGYAIIAVYIVGRLFSLIFNNKS